MTKYHVGDEFLLHSAFGLKKAMVEAVYNSPCGTMYEIDGEMVYGDKMHNYTHIQKIEPSYDAKQCFQLVSEYEVNLPDGARVVTNKFFVRGNLALDWKSVQNACKFEVECVAIDESGYAYAYSYRETAKFNNSHMPVAGYLEKIGVVGQICPDWRDLIFYPPQEDSYD